MTSMELTISGTSKIFVGVSFKKLDEFCSPGNTVVVSDENVLRYHGERLAPYRVIEIAPGEGEKTLKTVNGIYDRFLDMNVDRSTAIVGMGGGIVCDITGFAASTYLRGVPFGFVPTTLLSQVDAGVGGKNGINFHGYKNLVGTFNQPGFVLCDHSFLKTLPYDEIKNGIAECIKCALISDAAFFDYIEQSRKAIIELDDDTIRRIVRSALAIKAAVVARDERESGERRILNFGHTIGHAIEKTGGQGHGEAVSVGIAMAARLSEMRGYLVDKDVARITSVLASFGLPAKPDSDGHAIVDAIRKDKKREGSSLHFVFLRGVGKAVIETVSIAELQEAVLGLCQHM